MIELLMKFGANIHWRGTDGMTALRNSKLQNFLFQCFQLFFKKIV